MRIRGGERVIFRQGGNLWPTIPKLAQHACQDVSFAPDDLEGATEFGLADHCPPIGRRLAGIVDEAEQSLTRRQAAVPTIARPFRGGQREQPFDGVEGCAFSGPRGSSDDEGKLDRIMSCPRSSAIRRASRCVAEE